MKKIVLMIAALLMLSTADADAQGFLKKLKQKAQAVVGNASGDEESKDADDADERFIFLRLRVEAKWDPLEQREGTRSKW